MAIHPGEICNKMFESLGQPGGFGVDAVRFGWVDTFLKDQQARREIEELQAKIKETETLTMDKGELEAWFRKWLADVKQARLEQVRRALREVQDFKLRKEELVLFRFNNALVDFDPTEKDFEFLFADLAEGVSRAEKDKRIAKMRAEIEAREKLIKEELSPKERWFFRDNGVPFPYPKGCRWTQYVQVWREVASRYAEPVSVEGFKLETEEERRAYAALELGKVFKKGPLSEGIERRRRQ